VARFSALLDTCVLVPIALADTLLRLAEADLFRPLWSERILEEMVSAIEEIHPELTGGPARKRADTMDRAFDDACVQGWEPLVDGIVLPDTDDRHVVAAAQRGHADLIVTANLRDFPASSLELLGIEVQGPDDFLLNQLDLDPDIVIRVLHAQAAATQRPAISFDALVDHLARCGVPRFASAAAQQKWRGP
jgi:predicted nucleic acid-binding protein